MFELGNSLREARLRRRIDFAEAEQATKVRAKYLKALEEEQFDTLPSQTYIKGFLRTYAEYLGLDGQLYVDEYNSRFAVGEDYRPRRSSVRPQRRNRRFETNAVLVVLALIALGTIGVIGAWTSSRHDTEIPHVATTTARAPARVVPPLLAVHAVGGPSHLVVHVRGAGGRLLFEGTLLRGQQQNFRGSRLWVEIGTPANVRLVHRGQALKPLHGRRSKVILVGATGIRPAT